MVSHKDYSRELGAAYLDRGFAIANPQPGLVDTRSGRSLPRVKIGDVGYIDRSQGNFIRLFNIHKVPGEEAQPGPDHLPTDFVPLEPELSNQRNITEDTTQLFKTESVIVKGGEGRLQGPELLNVLTVGGSLNFTSTCSSGAVLLTPGPRPITRIDANRNDIKRYMEYAMANMDRWITFFEAEHLEPTDILLLTGIDRTATWAAAAFAGSKREFEFSINVDLQSVGGIEIAPKLSWDRCDTIMANSYQRPSETTRGFGAKQDTQTLFVRRLRIKRRKIMPGYKMKAAAEPHDVNVGKDEDLGDDGRIAFEMAESPEPEEFVDALTPILNFILEHSEAKIAIAHDDSLPLYKRIAADEVQDPPSFIAICDNGVGYLRIPVIALPEDVPVLVPVDLSGPESITFETPSAAPSAVPLTTPDQHSHSYKQTSGGKGGKPGDEYSEKGYDGSVDYCLKLRSHLASIRQLDQFKWDLRVEGPINEQKHYAVAKLNGKTLGTAKWSTKNLARKIAAFRALKSLGVL